MDYEKKYKEGVEWLRDWIYLATTGEMREQMEKHFPELVESDDERIRKELIRAFKSLNTIKIWNGIERTDILAWLEKQGDANKEYWRGYREGMEEILDKYAELEKQGEQKSYDTCDSSMTDDKKSPYSEKRDFGYFEEKPADKVEPIEWSGKINSRNAKGVLKEMLDEKLKSEDKVEPKFHEGEWITNGDYTWKIVEVKSLDYILQSQDGNIVDDTISHVDEQFHSFTIEDAKDGDVLVFKNNISGIIICKSPTNYDTRSYCRFVSDFFVGKEEGGWDSTLLYPATKEQRDTLFKAMADAGYTFDFENKELRKIKHDVQLTEFEHALKDMMNTYRDAIGDNDVTIEEVKERAAYMLSLINPKSAWSEEDERTIKRIDSLLYAINESDFEDIHAWLKSLKDRALQQPKQEWSKEDENVMWLLKDIVKHSNEINENIYTMPLKEKLYDWLKSLRPQNRWKPNIEQLEALWCATEKYIESDNEQVRKLRGEVLESLYNDLKKLRGE